MTPFGKKVIFGTMVIILAISLFVHYLRTLFPGRIAPAPIVASTTTSLEVSSDVATSTSALTLAIGETGTSSGVAVTPTKLIEDSRCPKDVTCVRAGTVSVKTMIRSVASTTEAVLTLGQPVHIGYAFIMLSTITPGKSSTTTLLESDYRFMFTTRSMEAASGTNVH